MIPQDTIAYKFSVATKGATLTSSALHTSAAATSFYTMTCTVVDPELQVPAQLHTRAFFQTDGCQAFVSRVDPDTLFDRCTKDVCKFWAESASNAWAFATAIDVAIIVSLIMVYNCSQCYENHNAATTPPETPPESRIEKAPKQGVNMQKTVV
jgi:hypothetical protein